MEMAEVMRQRRAELGMSQTDLAEQAGVGVRQIRRYEAGEQEPGLTVGLAIAKALRITVSELTGERPQGINLTGEWWMSWQTSKDGEEVITAQEVRFAQEGDLIDVQTLTRGIEVEDGGYHWHGELRLWDNEILMGWYAANDGSVRSKGTMYFVLHPHGVSMTGRWVGLSYDGKIMTGWGAMGRTEEDARGLIEQLKGANA
ncbi:helix-turn-helix transcriptional regulator [Lentzea jiangxiensis]|uniref:DNA-binding transcriptional regulator, XRE-family HTH domain n=1 Tax=Lentzea jiangxiensis TaxID=641025 RepID=A0A1H0MKW1_9PSEU|nr:helix-turn-helix transcriptional regulator [Lentzea jiangxiensis]SDO81011.1 DNA-binding transcriptional regulator, XRE-family HTH domain [Lentzea jiangxiensis]